jgi:hypothetical protein
MGHSRQDAVNERETGKMLSHVETRPLLQDGSWPDARPIGQMVTSQISLGDVLHSNHAHMFWFSRKMPIMHFAEVSVLNVECTMFPSGY